MLKCKMCGGNLVLVNNTYHCPYCGNGYDTDNTQLGKTAVADLKSADNGVDVFESNVSGIVEITWSDGAYSHSGSGFLIDKTGYAITNTHVVTHEDGRTCECVNVKIAGEETTAWVIKLGDDRHGSGSGIDLALISIDDLPRRAKPLSFADFNKVRIGQKIFVIGNSLGYGTCITSGIVSDKRRNVAGKSLLMTDCAVNGGNSGGPVFDESGKVIGVIVSGITGAEGMNFAIPSDDVIGFIKNTSSTHRVSINQDNAPIVKLYSSARCPKCGSNQTNEVNGIHYCFICDYEW